MDNAFRSVVFLKTMLLHLLHDPSVYGTRALSSRLSASENLNVIHDLTSFLRSKCRKSVKYTSCHIMVKTKR